MDVSPARVRAGDPSGAAPAGHVNLCGIVCPTEAIRKLTHPEKVQWKIGTAEFDKNRCLPWARSVRGPWDPSAPRPRGR